MKSLLTKSIFMLLSLIAAVSLNGQSKVLQNNASLDNGESSNFQYRIGELLAETLVGNCSIYIGRVENIQPTKIDLSIQEQLWGQKAEGTGIQLNNFSRVRRTGLESETTDPWKTVDLQRNTILLTSYCQNSMTRNKLVVSDQMLFPLIQEVIGFHQDLQQNPSVFSESPELLKRSKNLVLAGYTIFLLKNRVPIDVNQQAIVSVQLLENPDLPIATTAFLRIVLRSLIFGERGIGLVPEVQTLVTSKLVGIASSDGKSNRQVILLLIDLAGKSKVNIVPFLNEEKRQKFIDNYRKLGPPTINFDGRKELEKQLAIS